jgi:hypothetical protein
MPRLLALLCAANRSEELPVFQMWEGEAGRCSKRFDLGRPRLLGDGRCSQTTKIRPNVSTTVAANLADEQTFDIRQPQMVWPAIG